MGIRNITTTVYSVQKALQSHVHSTHCSKHSEVTDDAEPHSTDSHVSKIYLRHYSGLHKYMLISRHDLSFENHDMYSFAVRFSSSFSFIPIHLVYNQQSHHLRCSLYLYKSQCPAYNLITYTISQLTHQSSPCSSLLTPRGQLSIIFFLPSSSAI